MRIQNLSNIENILRYSHNDPDSDGVWLESLWSNIRTGNPHFTLNESFEALIVVLRFLLQNDLIYFMKNDDKQQKVINWKMEGEDVLSKLKNYLSNFNEREIKKNPAFLDMFEYPAINWTVKWPLNLEKYGLQ